MFGFGKRLFKKMRYAPARRYYAGIRTAYTLFQQGIICSPKNIVNEQEIYYCSDVIQVRACKKASQTTMEVGKKYSFTVSKIKESCV